MASRRLKTRTPEAALMLLLLLALALLPYGAQRAGTAAGARVVAEAPLLSLFATAMLALLLATYALARKRRIIL